jgi:alanine dehydrogenase
MQFSLVKETATCENRVALTPSGVGQLIAAGHEVFVQTDAGFASHFSDSEYQEAGATIVYTPEEAYARGDVVVKVLPPRKEEVEYLTEDRALLCFLQLAAGRESLLEQLLEQRTVGIGLELVSNRFGRKPIVISMSEIAGQLAVQIGSNYLLSGKGGRGLLLGAIPGMSGSVVTILGAGTLGLAAARTAMGMGAQVVLLDHNVCALRDAQRLLGPVSTMMATTKNMKHALSFADIAVGAISQPGQRTKHLVTRQMVRSMKKGAVVMDTSVDMGGCFETTRPTTLESPTFLAEGVVHCCIPNLPSFVCRTSSRSLSISIAPLLLQLAEEKQPLDAILADEGLRAGLVTANGQVTNRELADLYDRRMVDAQDLLKK